MIRNRIYLVFLVFFFLLPFYLAQSVIEEGGEDVVNINVGGRNVEATGVDCFDYYHFGSIEFDYPHPEKTIYKPGETASVVTTIINNNDYAIVQGNVIAQIYYENKESGNYQGDHLLKEFLVFDGLALLPKQTYDLAVEWKIPKDAPKGRYEVALYFQELHAFNLSGLPFITNYYGGLASFDVDSTNDKLPFYFDRNAVMLNGKHQLLRHFSENFEPGNTITYEIPLVNPTANKQTVTVNYELYSWDQSDESNLLSKYYKSETIEIPAKSSKKVSISFSDLEPSAYELKISASNETWSSIILLRFTVKGAKGRFIHTGLTSFPLLKGTDFTMFACFSNTTDWFTNFNGEVILELKDNRGNVLATERYSGEITPKIMAIKKDLTALECYDELYLKATIKDADTGKLHQEITKVYRLSDFRDADFINKFLEDKERIEATSTPAKPTPPTVTKTPTIEKTPGERPVKPQEPILPMETIIIVTVVVIAVVIATFYYMRAAQRGEK